MPKSQCGSEVGMPKSLCDFLDFVCLNLCLDQDFRGKQAFLYRNGFFI